MKRTRAALISMTSVVANLPEGPPIKIAQGPEHENSPPLQMHWRVWQTWGNRNRLVF